MKRLILFFTLMITSFSASAGVYEISAMYNFKKTNYDATHADSSESGTASMAYYFWEMSAIEVSYTRGAARLDTPEQIIYQNITAVGLNFLFTFAGRESAFKPYLKAGGSYLEKKINYYIPTGSTFQVTAPTQAYGIAPTAGIGFKYMLSQQFGIKTGVDVTMQTFSVGTQSSTTYDFTANAGISFLF